MQGRLLPPFDGPSRSTKSQAMKSRVTNTTLLRKALLGARRIGISAGTVYAGVCIFLVVFQSFLIYQPSGPYEATPADAGLPYEEVTS